MGFIDTLVALASKLFLSVFLGVLTLLTPLLPSAPSSTTTPAVSTAVVATATSSTEVRVASTTTTKPPIKKVGSAPATIPTPPVAPVIATTTAATLNIGAPVEDLNASARASIVNILCTTKNGDVLHPITASGVFIDSRGIILANAHVGQYFLLKEYRMADFIECVARTGNPAYPRYKLGLVYISPQWVRDNASQIKSATPTGTGENDFALLYVTGPTDPNGILPTSFPAASIDTSEQSFTIGATMLVAAYPAGFLGGETILRDLYLSSAYTEIKDIYTFTTTPIDVISIGGSVVAQKGSSGGGVFSLIGKLVGIISTSSDGPTTDVRDLHAITLAHINRSIQAENGTGLSMFLSGDIALKASDFAVAYAPTLTKLLTDQLP